MSLYLYHESLSIPCIQVYTMSQCPYQESKSIPRVHINTISPCLYHACLYHESFSIPCIHVYSMNPSLYHTRRFRKKSNFTMQEIQFHIRTNPISNQNKSFCLLPACTSAGDILYCHAAFACVLSVINIGYKCWTSNCCWIGLKPKSHQETSINQYFLAVILYCNHNKNIARIQKFKVLSFITI